MQKNTKNPFTNGEKYDTIFLYPIMQDVSASRKETNYDKQNTEGNRAASDRRNDRDGCGGRPDFGRVRIPRRGGESALPIYI